VFLQGQFNLLFQKRKSKVPSTLRKSNAANKVQPFNTRREERAKHTLKVWGKSDEATIMIRSPLFLFPCIDILSFIPPSLTHKARERERSRSEHLDTKEERERRLKGGKEREGLQRMQPHTSVLAQWYCLSHSYFLFTHTHNSLSGEKQLCTWGKKKKRGVEINKE
jgi:hypothetical protein